MDYFFAKVLEVMSEQYTPSVEDYLKCHVRNTGMIDYKYDIEDNEFAVYDVGGPRMDRRRCIRHIAGLGVAAVMFVCALNHCHAVLFENEKKNAMHEQIELFTEICNGEWFKDSEMILLFNKADLFRENLKAGISLSKCFSKQARWKGLPWNGPDNVPTSNNFEECYSQAIQFIQNAFLSVNEFQNRVIHCHITCATDIDQNTMQKVYWDVQNIVIRANLRRGAQGRAPQDVEIAERVNVEGLCQTQLRFPISRLFVLTAFHVHTARFPCFGRFDLLALLHVSV